MKSSLRDMGLLALAYGSSIASAASIPVTKQGSKSPKSAVLDVRRDEKGLQAAIERQRGNHTNTHDAHKRGSFGPDSLSYSGYWFADITLGGQDASVLLDTGSADLWVFSPSTASSANGAPVWDPSTSSNTTPMDGYTFDLGYGEGGNGVSGPVYQTVTCVGDICVYMAAGSATEAQNENFVQSGIMGMAFQGGNSIRPNNQPTFVESIVGALDQPIFSFEMSTTGGQLAFGDIPFNYEAPFQEITVDTSSSAPYPYSWSYTDIQYSVNGDNLGTFDVVFDTGGPMTSAAESIVRGYYAQVNGAVDVNGDASSWTAPCGSNLPDLRLDFNNGAFLIIPGFRFFAGNNATTGQCQTWFVKENSATRAVIGDPFFDEHVVVFNQNTGSIQWANQA